MAVYDHGVYKGANYELQPSYFKDQSGEGNGLSPFVGYKLPMGVFGLPTDPRTANQLKAVSDKISTGTKAVEVTGIDVNVLDYIPKQHFTEIQRLKKLAGVELTFHGPLVEPTGLNPQAGKWEEQQRVQAERQMINAIDRAHDLDSKGNIVVTFHSSNGLPEPKTMVKDPKTGIETMESMYVIDEESGKFGMLQKQGENYFERKPSNMMDDLAKYNEEQWSGSLSSLSRAIQLARERIDLSSDLAERASKQTDKLEPNVFIKLYKDLDENPNQYNQFMNEMRAKDPSAASKVDRAVTELANAKRFTEETYFGLQQAFNKAYGFAKKDENPENQKKLEELNSLRKEIAPLINKYKEDPSKLVEFTEQVARGVSMLNTMEAPKSFHDMESFAIDKASDTFANVAFHGYKTYKSSAPVVSIENPPVGMGLSRGEDLRKIVEASQRKFIEKAQAEGLSKEKARQEAERLIGVTWDVGHINMMRKHGYDDKDILKQTDKVKEFVKHIHLSDNFGLEHTELPMGMGNVPIKEHEEMLKKQFGEKFNKIKQIVETGGWYQHFKSSPLAETFQAFGSPITGPTGNSYWNGSRGTGGGYFTGYGRFLPENNFATYGSSFTALPTELGGQISGRNRLSGAPME